MILCFGRGSSSITSQKHSSKLSWGFQSQTRRLTGSWCISDWWSVTNLRKSMPVCCRNVCTATVSSGRRMDIPAASLHQMSQPELKSFLAPKSWRQRISWPSLLIRKWRRDSFQTFGIIEIEWFLYDVFQDCVYLQVTRGLAKLSLIVNVMLFVNIVSLHCSVCMSPDCTSLHIPSAILMWIIATEMLCFFLIYWMEAVMLNITPVVFYNSPHWPSNLFYSPNS